MAELSKFSAKNYIAIYFVIIFTYSLGNAITDKLIFYLGIIPLSIGITLGLVSALDV